MSSSPRSTNQQSRLCMEFKQHCGTQGYDLSGDSDWCDIDAKYYIKKNKLYQGQVNCHSLDFLINSWESQLTNMPVGWPTPTWPKDPYTGVSIPIHKLLEYTALFETLEHSTLPNKLTTLIYNLRNPDELVFQLLDGTLDVTDRNESEQRKINDVLFHILYSDQDDEDDVENSADNENTHLPQDKITQFTKILLQLLHEKNTLIINSLTNRQFNTFIGTLPDLTRFLNTPAFITDFNNIASLIASDPDNDYLAYDSPMTNNLTNFILNKINSTRSRPLTEYDSRFVTYNIRTAITAIMELLTKYPAQIPDRNLNILTAFINTLASTNRLNEIYSDDIAHEVWPDFIVAATKNLPLNNPVDDTYIEDILLHITTELNLDRNRNDIIFTWLTDAWNIVQYNQ